MATNMATPSAIRAAHCAARRRPPSNTNSATIGNTAKIELRASEFDTGSKFCVYTLLLPRLSCGVLSRLHGPENRKR
jgi:hypothetical protein